MRDMVHSICLIKLYQITMRKKFNLKSKIRSSRAFIWTQNVTTNVCVPSDVNFNFWNRFIHLNRPIKGADKVCGDSLDLKSPGKHLCLQMSSERYYECMCAFWLWISTFETVLHI